MLDLHGRTGPAWFTIDDVARAAEVHVDEVWRLVDLGQAIVHRQGNFLSTEDAVHLVRVLHGSAQPSTERARFNQLPRPARKTKRGIALAGVIHLAGLLVLIGLPWLALADKSTSEDLPKPDVPEVKLVYLMMPGPGGGGGGGGMNEPEPPPPARKKAPVVIAMKPVSRVPPARPHAAPPTPQPVPPRPEARVIPAALDTPVRPVPQAVVAPVKSIAADPLEAIGSPIEGPSAQPSRGPGYGGGVGSGAGQGIGEGTGGGLGPGSGGGTGGGPYQAGSGIDPPTLVREVRPSYTDAARKQSIEGDVVLEIVVRDDGTVGNIRVRRSLGAGLEQKAIDAVRQWKFNPAKRRGTPVDVVVDVSVEFKLR